MKTFKVLLAGILMSALLAGGAVADQDESQQGNDQRSDFELKYLDE